MISFLIGMTAGAATVVGALGAWCLREARRERKERNEKRCAQRRQQPCGFCGNLSKNNDWMTQELPKL